MIFFFRNESQEVFVIHSTRKIAKKDVKKLEWLFNGHLIDSPSLEGEFVGPRVEMISPWSTNAVEITQNMGVKGFKRIEKFYPYDEQVGFDPMLEHLYHGLDEKVYHIDRTPDPVLEIEDIAAYNKQEGLALSDEEIIYLEELSKRINRPLTDSEVFGFSQVNSEHCRHKIFNGVFIIDGEEKIHSLFKLIRNTSSANPNRIVSAYSDNVAFIEGPEIIQFAPEHADKAAFFFEKPLSSVLSLKAETHNFPTTVEPFNGAATGTGGEIRDRMAGGKGSIPLAGTAVYMTAYPRTKEGRIWERFTQARKWLYQNPEEILIKASNGASDFGNKFGQPLICGSLLTFEFEGKERHYGYDKVIMLAGGVGFARADDSLKGDPEKGDRIVVMGGDNYRIGMGGGSVSSVATGEYDNTVELNAVQRSNPEMQKRVANVIRALAEMEDNPVVSVHDHGAGGHLNALSELIETTGGTIYIDKLPVGDKTLSFKEIIGNESQERMGLLMHKKHLSLLKKISERERAPLYDVGEASKNGKLLFQDKKSGARPINLQLHDMFGNPPQTVLTDNTPVYQGEALVYESNEFTSYLKAILQLEAVASKDWLTNKVDRSVTGRVAVQQCTGKIQLPLNNLGVMALDYQGVKGVATSIGHAPVAALLDPGAGSILSVSEALTNLLWAPIEQGLKGVSLSANWMWPAKNEGENARLYAAVEAISKFAIQLGINIPTGKDSLSMKQQYSDKTVYSPGTVIVSTVGEVRDIRKVVTPNLKDHDQSVLLYVDFSGGEFALGGSSFAQLLGQLGDKVPGVTDPDYFGRAFTALQKLVEAEQILAGHDVSSGGLITTLLEMCFPNVDGGLKVGFDVFEEEDLFKLAFSEKPAVVVQVPSDGKAIEVLSNAGVKFYEIAVPQKGRKFELEKGGQQWSLDIDELRNTWMESSYLLDRKQCGSELAKKRFENYAKQALKYKFPENYERKLLEDDDHEQVACAPRAAIIREKGVNGDREMAYSLYAAGFEVKDIHMTDLISGKENLEDIQMLVFVGGFSNSDVLGSAKGWAGAFLYNKKAQQSLKKFYEREDTLSLGVCNGCQLMTELNLLGYKKGKEVSMLHNDSHKFESAFLGVEIHDTEAIMLKGLEGSQLGIWVAHGEGKFDFGSHVREDYQIAMTYTYDQYPGNPNGSEFNAAAICSSNGRHLAMMPHLERSLFSWQWPDYPEKHKGDTTSPWYQAFVNALDWIESF
jgi:phosphoribosylformylglycinamidine synthase